MRVDLVTLISICAGIAAPGADLLSTPSIDDARLHDQSIEIRSSVCRDFGGCKNYTISIDRNGRGSFKLMTEGGPKVRGFVLTQYVFRKVQVTLEPLRPARTNTTFPCEECGADYEATTVVWISDRGTRQTADFKQSLQGFEDDIGSRLLTAQNLLLSNLAPGVREP